MMDNKNIVIKIIAAIVLLLISIAIFFIDVDLKIFKISSVKSLFTKYSEIKNSESTYVQEKTNYESVEKSILTAKNEFAKQKREYDLIDSETIRIIKEATMDEKYNVEYMWIKLGNYAKSNNLTLSLVEPGGTVPTATTPQTGTTTPTTNATTPSSTTTPTAPSTTTPSSTTPTTQNVTPNTTNAGTTSTNKTTGTTPTAPSTTAPSTTTPAPTTAAPATLDSSEFSIKVKGNYINVSDFIFEVENDKELKFKLDKIKMEYSGNNLITATFVVKNLVFVK